MLKYLKNKSKQAYSFGNIENLDAYLYKEYKIEPILISEKNLEMARFTCRNIELGVGNCTLISMVRSMEYLRDFKRLDRIPTDRMEIYKDIKNIAGKYFYSDRYGTLPIFAASIYEAIFRYYDYNAYSKGIFLWDFNDDIVREIDLGYPVIFNIARGYYKNHSITISGYKIYRVKNKIIKIAIVHDGWKNKVRYLNFSQLERNLLFAGLGSFNNIRVRI